uniref:Uncharacterized protein n=1 Tax=Strigamia maritima TaxID=126957 RepID=T1JP49_STRMM
CDVCGENHETEECPILSAGKKVEDAAAPSRARLTLPATLEVRDLADGTTSVVTNELITSATQFGPFEANRTLEFNLATRFPLKVFCKDGPVLHLDATDERQCNWMALVAPATGEEEMNLIAYQAKDDIFFSAVKQIKPGKELRVWYAPHYSRKMAVPATWEISNSGFSENVHKTPVKKGTKRKRRMTKQKSQNVYYSGDDDTFDEFESVQSHDEVVQQLDPRRLGFKDTQEWKCSQCGLVFQKCLDFAHHLSDHYKPRQLGAKRRDAGIKRPKNFPCDICGQKFTTERLLHKHRMRNHQKVLREIRKSQRLEKLSNAKKQDKKESENVENDQNDSVEAETVANIAAELAASGAYQLVDDIQDQSQDNSKLDSGGEDDVEYPTIPQHESQIQDDENSQSPSVESNDRQKEPYSCDICHKSFEKSTYLFRHIRKHTGDFTCLKCYKVFARKESMLKHQCSGIVESGDDTTSEFLCSYCNKSFARDYLLRRHLSKHTGEFGCELCGKNYSSKDALMDHSCPNYPDMERYTCEICHKTFTKLKYLDKHIPVHTGIFSCAICGKWLRSNDSLINHMRICGLVKELQANGTAICPHCKQEFDDLKTFRRHMYDHTHMFACESCNARFRNKLSLSVHVCDTERAMTCDECGKDFNSIASLNRHRSTHGEPQFSCDICGRSYYREEALLKHPCERAKRTKGRQSSGRRPPSLMPLICEICGSMFSSTSSLNVHKNLHGEKKYACEVCDKRFHRKDLLLEHRAVHGEPDIPCPVCGKMFKTKKSLDVHLLIHDGVKRFKCQTCDKMFYQKGNLQKHEETHTPGRKHSCPHCNKAFSSKEYLTIHVLEHTRGRIFTCPTCTRSFVKVIL